MQESGEEPPEQIVQRVHAHAEVSERQLRVATERATRRVLPVHHHRRDVDARLRLRQHPYITIEQHNKKLRTAEQ